MTSDLILAVVVDVIETKTENADYRNLLFESKEIETDAEFIVESYNVKCVPIETANKYSKALKAGKVCKAHTTLR
jgi:hypothetical protein|tara:strand:+ start:500 stop:724 length:225 start_codon:yes stop_codon:yes gene_type:complete